MGIVNSKRKPDYNYMVSVLNYNQDTGVFTWKLDHGKGGRIKAGTVAGYINSTDRYRYIKIDKLIYSAHRLAYYYIHKYYPENMIDHINRNRDDNRIENLREAAQTCQNINSKQRKDNTSGIKGIVWHKITGKWRPTITKSKKTFSLGLYTSFSEAVCARYAGEQALGWKGCDANSPACQYVCNMVGGVSLV